MNTLDCLQHLPARTSLNLAAAIGMALAASASAQDANLKWLSADVQAKVGTYRPNPQPLRLTETKPASLKIAPADLKATLYGELKIGPKDSPSTHIVALDETDGQPARLFIDANGNGNLTDDPVILWEEKISPGSGTTQTSMYNGKTKIKISYPGGAKEAQLLLSRYGKNASTPAAFRTLLFYSRDYALAGDIKFGNKSYATVLLDEAATGDFRAGEGKAASIRFLIDANADGKFDPRRESFDTRAPFNVGGTTYEIADMKPDGRFRLTKSSKTVEEILPAPDLAKGAKALPFTAQDTAGKDVKFPADYKGKVLLLDFWAVWCGPCVREVPNVVANYEKFHDKGFEILGISFDRENSADKVAAFTKEKSMPWQQIYEGKFWSTTLGKLYDVRSIPMMLLVDGDTAEILAVGGELRGPNLGPAIESALARKSAAAKTDK